MKSTVDIMPSVALAACLSHNFQAQFTLHWAVFCYINQPLPLTHHLPLLPHRTWIRRHNNQRSTHLFTKPLPQDLHISPAALNPCHVFPCSCPARCRASARALLAQCLGCEAC